VLPKGWDQLEDEDGDIYYVRPDGGTQWEWPDVVQAEKQAKWLEEEEQRIEEEAKAELESFAAKMRAEEEADKKRQAEQKEAVARLERERVEAYEAAMAAKKLAEAEAEAAEAARRAQVIQEEAEVMTKWRADVEAFYTQRNQAREQAAAELKARRAAEEGDEVRQARRELEIRLQGRQGCKGLLDVLREAYGSEEATNVEVITAALSFVQAKRVRHVKEITKFRLTEAMVGALPGLDADATASRLREALQRVGETISTEPPKPVLNPSMSPTERGYIR